MCQSWIIESSIFLLPVFPHDKSQIAFDSAILSSHIFFNGKMRLENKGEGIRSPIYISMSLFVWIEDVLCARHSVKLLTIHTTILQERCLDGGSADER